MGRSMRVMLQNGRSYDETDRMPSNLTITNFDLSLYIVAIVGHFIDLGVDINIAVRYYLANKVAEFSWTLVFILLPAFINTAVSVRMYSQDKQLDSVSNEVTKRKYLRIFILILQMAPVLRFVDSLIYAIKSRDAARKNDTASQKQYYKLMLKEDSDAALLRIFECFLEAAPQQVLQMSLLFYGHEYLKLHQGLSIISSMIGLGWCLAAYQRAVRFSQDKDNMDWRGTMLQTMWHFLVSLSRITSISIIAHLYPHWTILACAIHILVMSSWLQFFDRPAFCTQNKFAEVAFSFALGSVYLFTYILPVEGRTRYRYAMYYTICFLQNVTCAALWYFYVTEHMRAAAYFYPIIVLCVVPYVLGIVFMLVYYRFFHPKLRKARDTQDFNEKFEATEMS